MGADPGYAAFDGTSMASPLVAGIAGLVKHEHPDYAVPAQERGDAVRRPSRQPADAVVVRERDGDPEDADRRRVRGPGTRERAEGADGLDPNATPLTDGNIDGAVLLGGTVQRSVAWPRDVNDVYRKRLAAGNRYRIRLNGPPNKDMDLWVWRPGDRDHQFTSGCFNPNGACRGSARCRGASTPTSR